MLPLTVTNFLSLRFRSKELNRKTRFARNTDSILKQLMKEALDIILEECHDRRLLPSKLSRHMSSLKKQKSLHLKKNLKSNKTTRKGPKIRCRNVRVLLYYTQHLFC